MSDVSSERSFLGFYVALIFICLFFSLMSFATIGIFIHLYKSSEFETRNYGMLPLSAGILILWFYIVYKFIRYSPSIEINKDFIRINSADFYWKDVDEIELTGKRPYIFFYQKEGMLLKFKGQKAITVLDDLYANLGEIKLFIKTKIIDKSTSPIAIISKPSTSEISNEQFISYNKSQFFNFRGVTLWAILAGLIYAAIRNMDHPVGLFFIFCMGCITFFGLSYFLYYVKMSNRYLVVKNPNFFWVKKIYRLKDIKEVVFEQQDRWPNCIIIITNDFKSGFFPAASLWNKQFRELKSKLEEMNIKVRDEISIG